VKLYYHPISSYSQKALFAFHEKGIPFTPSIVNVMDPPAKRAYQQEIYPIGKVPLLEEEGLQLPEAGLIAEWIDQRYPDTGTRLVPADPALRLEAAKLDRFADCYLNEPMQKVLFDPMRAPDERDPRGVRVAKSLLDRAYGCLEARLEQSGGPWLLGETFTLADVSAASPLFYLQRAWPFTAHPHLSAYATRLLERPAWKKVVQEAAPYLEAFAKA
jgi:glutathione S-transferase